MPNEYIDQFRPRDFFRLNGAPLNDVDLMQIGVVPGVRLLKSDAQGFIVHGNTPFNLPASTGYIVRVGLVDDGADANDLGRVVRLGFTFKRLVGGTDNLTLAAAGTEQTVDVTLNATAGVIVFGSLNVLTANLDSIATGDPYLLRVRRIGTATQDTVGGPVVMTQLDLRVI